jgi:hypothetical protein
LESVEVVAVAVVLNPAAEPAVAETVVVVVVAAAAPVVAMAGPVVAATADPPAAAAAQLSGYLAESESVVATGYFVVPETLGLVVVVAAEFVLPEANVPLMAETLAAMVVASLETALERFAAATQQASGVPAVALGRATAAAAAVVASVADCSPAEAAVAKPAGSIALGDEAESVASELVLVAGMAAIAAAFVSAGVADFAAAAVEQATALAPAVVAAAVVAVVVAANAVATAFEPPVDFVVGRMTRKVYHE